MHAQTIAAQNSGAEIGQSVDGLEEIIVTAERREESLSHVAITETAFNARDLRERSITNQNELQSLVPGLIMITTNGANEFDYAIRGQTLQAYSGSAPGVLAYLNNVPMSPHNESAGTLYDLAGIEVLKGPQGTLFGRNNTGGAILYKTTQPTDEFGGYVTVTGGSYRLASFEGAINAPLIPGVLNARLAGSYQHEDGYINNVLNGTTVGDINNRSVRLTVKWTPTAALTSTFLAQYDNAHGTEDNPQIFSSYVPGQTNNGFALSDLTYVLTNGAQAHYAALAQKNPYNEYLPYTGPHSYTGVTYQNTTTYDLTDNMQIKNIAGTTINNAIISIVTNASPTVILADLDPTHCCNGLDYEQRDWSEELQLVGTTADQRLKYLVGAFGAYNGAINNWPLTFFDFSFFWRFKTIDYSKAVFTQETYDLSQATGVEGLSATVGMRYTWEELGDNQLPGGINYIPRNPLRQRSNESAPSWQGGLQYQFNPATLFYAVTRGSWRAGGYNNGNTGDNLNAFKKETTHDVEMGVKFDGKLLDRPFRVSAAVFEQWNRDYQTTLYVIDMGSPTTATVNVSRAQIRGEELALESRVTPWLRLGVTGAFTSAKFTDPTAAGGGFTGVVTNFANTPHFSGTTYAAVDLPVPDAWGAITFRADTYSVTKTPFSNFEYSILPDTTLPGYTTVNLRLDWNDILGSKASVSVFGKNVFDRTYWIGGFPVGFIDGTNLAVPAKPANFGVQASYRF